MKESLAELAKRFKRIVRGLESNRPGEYRQGVECRENAIEAVRLLAEAVVVNRGSVVSKDGFDRLISAYVNIMLYGKTKEAIKPALSSLGWLNEDMQNRIIRLSEPGMYWGLSQPLVHIQRFLYPYRNEFLDLIEKFLETDEFESLRQSIWKFTGPVPNKGTAFMTGIIAALRPEHFIVYNKRSILPLWNTDYYRYFKNSTMKKYLEFNHIYRVLAKHTGLSLVSLDIAANKMHWDTR